MEESQDSQPDNNWLIVIEKMKEKYESYCLRDDKTYPPLQFNWTPEPYQRLIESFQEELSLQLGRSRAEVKSMVPSASTFAQIFRTNYQPKGEKLRACYLYATGKSRPIFVEENQIPEVTAFNTPTRSGDVFVSQRKRSLIFATVFAILLALLFYLSYQSTKASPSGLMIEQPINGTVVPMLTVIKGSVSNADLVWVIVRDMREDVYYVQHPIRVKDNGMWSGVVHVGGENKSHIGSRVQIRAFVNPVKDFVIEETLYTWPKAELSSSTINAVRGGIAK